MLKPHQPPSTAGLFSLSSSGPPVWSDLEHQIGPGAGPKNHQIQWIDHDFYHGQTIYVPCSSIFIWLLVYLPPEKYEFVNWDDDIPNIWRKKKVMFQTPNQSSIFTGLFQQDGKPVTHRWPSIHFLPRSECAARLAEVCLASSHGTCLDRSVDCRGN